MAVVLALSPAPLPPAPQSSAFYPLRSVASPRVLASVARCQLGFTDTLFSEVLG